MSPWTQFMAIVNSAASRISPLMGEPSSATEGVAADSRTPLSSRSAHMRSTGPRLPLPVQPTREQAGFGSVSPLIPPSVPITAATPASNPVMPLPVELASTIAAHMDAVDGAWALVGKHQQLSLAVNLENAAPQHAIALLNFNPVARQQLAAQADPGEPLPQDREALVQLTRTLWAGARYLVAPQHHGLRAQVFDKLGVALDQLLKQSEPEGAALLKQVADHAIAATEIEQPSPDVATELLALLKLDQVIANNAIGLHQGVMSLEQRSRLHERVAALASDATSYAGERTSTLSVQTGSSSWGSTLAAGASPSEAEVPVAALELAIAQPNFPVAAYRTANQASILRAAAARLTGTAEPTSIRIHRALDDMLLRRMDASSDSAELLRMWSALTSRKQLHPLDEGAVGASLVGVLKKVGSDPQNVSAVLDGVSNLLAFRSPQLLLSIAACAHEALETPLKDDTTQAKRFSRLLRETLTRDDDNADARKQFLAHAKQGVAALSGEAQRSWMATVVQVASHFVAHDRRPLVEAGELDNTVFVRAMWAAYGQ